MSLRHLKHSSMPILQELYPQVSETRRTDGKYLLHHVYHTFSYVRTMPSVPAKSLYCNQCSRKPRVPGYSEALLSVERYQVRSVDASTVCTRSLLQSQHCHCCGWDQGHLLYFPCTLYEPSGTLNSLYNAYRHNLTAHLAQYGI